MEVGGLFFVLGELGSFVYFVKDFPSFKRVFFFLTPSFQYFIFTKIRSIDLISTLLHTILLHPCTLAHFILHPSLYIVDLVHGLSRLLAMFAARVGEEWVRATSSVMRVVGLWVKGEVEEVQGGGVGRMRGEGVV